MPETADRQRRRVLGGLVLGAVTAALPAYADTVLALDTQGTRYRPPAFTQTTAAGWINAAPLRWEDLRGRVVLLDFWTFDCWNCYRSFPWLKSIEQRYADRGLQIVGIHTPEFDHEKDRERVVTKVTEFGLQHPIMLDNGFVYWHAIGNRYWPAYYLIDRRGRVRALYVGETHVDDPQARAVERDLEVLLAETPG
ncbi:redoxin domain-containing protein [Sinimarinibacterium sp. CAU 1509]|uniref:redoxin family protein n=1 Tax=Sinimarinibacterium sp. CAU 1509 TaxID=2562283 RepID=UPI0010ABA250|nr:redoxin family protein [Sinimarinibacterium sp. CAU 1509]TJY59453.1 redoxin domain-containing protein [Sinimarinibacterium sp. CAU 1509]